MSLEKFVDFIKIFRFQLPANDTASFSKEFKFALSLNQGELLMSHLIKLIQTGELIPAVSDSEQIIRFDFYRYLFLERNL